MTGRRFSISHVARRLGMRVSALRYYDRIGLLKPADDPIRDCPYLHEEFETEVDAALAPGR